MTLKRIHLFEFEDLTWFPYSMRSSLTRLLAVMHKILDTQKDITELLLRLINTTSTTAIVDLCSGSGGPMTEVAERIKKQTQISDLTLTLTDLYPDKKIVNQITSTGTTYLSTPINAADVPRHLPGIRTMICSFHHMKPEIATKILANAQSSKQPICIFEISDNSFPIFLWWIAIPLNFITAFFITPFTKGLTWQQVIFTYFIPVIPFAFAWDGAVSNARTYTLTDLDILLQQIPSEGYRWEKGVIKGKSTRLYLLGFPTITKSTKQ